MDEDFLTDLEDAEGETAEIAMGGSFFRGKDARKTRGLKVYQC